MAQADNDNSVFNQNTHTIDYLQTVNEDLQEPESKLAFYMLDVVIKLIIFVITFLGNLFTILAFIKFPSLRRISNWFLFSLAISDLFSGVVMVIQLVDFNKCAIIPQYLRLAFSHVFILVSMVHLLLIAADRYLAISQPLHYDGKMTPKRAGILIGTTWLLVAVMSMAPVLKFTTTADFGECRYIENTPYYVMLELMVFVITMVAISITYTKILLVVRRQQKRISQDLQLPQQSTMTQVQTEGVAYTQHTQATHSSQENQPANGKQSGSTTPTTRKINRPVVILSALILAFFILWTPYMLGILLVVLGAFIPTGHTMNVLLTLGFINSAVNTFVYAIISREYREAYTKILKCEY